MESEGDEEMKDDEEKDKIDEVKSLLQEYSSSKHMADLLLKFSQKVTASSELDKPFLVHMPTNLLLMIPTFEISLY